MNGGVLRRQGMRPPSSRANSASLATASAVATTGVTTSEDAIVTVDSAWMSALRVPARTAYSPPSTAQRRFAASQTE